MTPLAILLTLSSVLFTVGLFAVLTRRNAILILVGIELMLNAANINFIAFWRYGEADPELIGPMFVLFSIAIQTHWTASCTIGNERHDHAHGQHDEDVKPPQIFLASHQRL